MPRSIPDREANAGASISVLQHCHFVTAPVRRMMSALAIADLNSRRMWTIIDGYTTFRILRHFGYLPGGRSVREKGVP